jgi:hypothetical protein
MILLFSVANAQGLAIGLILKTTSKDGNIAIANKEILALNRELKI